MIVAFDAIRISFTSARDCASVVDLGSRSASLPKILSYVAENSSISNKLYAVCKTLLRQRRGMEMIVAKRSSGQRRGGADEWNGKDDAQTPQHDYAVIRLRPRTPNLRHDGGSSRHHRAFLALSRHGNLPGCRRLEPVRCVGHAARGRPPRRAKVDAIAWNGTSASWLGIDRDGSLCAAITKRMNVPATTSTLACIDAVRALGASRVDFITPYTDDVQVRIGRIWKRTRIACYADNFSFGDLRRSAR